MPGNVLITAKPHPFRQGRELMELPEGMTIREMVNVARRDQFLDEPVVVLEGEIIDERYWDHMRPKSGKRLEICVVPRGGGGGGKSILRILLTIVVVVIAILAPAIAVALGASAGVVGAGTIGGALLTAAVGAAGMLAVNAIAPLSGPSIDTDSSINNSQGLNINGARNTADPFGVVPVVLGRHKVVPRYGAQPFTENLGPKNALRIVFVWGIGPLHIDEDSISIGGTKIKKFIDTTIEHREGYDTDLPLKLYPKTVSQLDFQIKLAQTVGYVVRSTSGSLADDISFDVTFPRGLIAFSSTGSKRQRSVQIRFSYRKVGETTWVAPVLKHTSVPASWVQIQGDETICIFTHKDPNPFTHGFRWETGERAQYEVRVKRFNDDETDSNIFDEIWWTVLRDFTNEDPINSAVPLAKSALRIQATEQLNGIVNELNGIITSKGMDWDGNSWVADQPITNNASIFRLVLQGAGNLNPLPDSRIDLPKLQEWHEFCKANGFEFNQVRDYRTSVYQTLVDVCAAGRAAPTISDDGKWSVVIEEPKSIPVSFISPRNSFGFRAEKAFIDVPHGWRIRFPNELNGYQSDERRVFRDGFDDTNATLFETLETLGVTHPDQVFKLGRFRIAQGLLQPERWTVSQDMRYLTYQRGDRVSINHDVILVGLKAGRVKAVTVDGNNDVLSVEVDEKVEMEAGKTYGMAIHTPSNGEVTRGVDTVVGESTVLTFVTPIENISGQPAVGRHDEFAFGLLGQETDAASVVAIIPESDFIAKVVAVPYREEIFNADSETIPPFDPNITPLPVIPQPNILEIVTDESVLDRGAGNTLLIRAFIRVEDPGLDLGVLDVQARPSVTGEPYRDVDIVRREQAGVLIGGLEEGETLDFRCRWRTQGRLPGFWTEQFNVTIIGRSTPPQPLQNMTISSFGSHAYIQWDQPSELDVKFGGVVAFRWSPAFSGALWEGSSSLSQSAQAASRFAVLPLKPGTYLARVVDAGGYVSTVTSVTTKQATVLTYGPPTSIDEAPTFSGTHNGTVATSNTLTLDGAGLIDDEADFDAITDLDSLGGIIMSGTYDFNLGYDFMVVSKKRLTVRLDMVSDNTLENIDNRDGLIDDWDDIDGSDQSETDCTVWARYTDDDPAGSPTWTAWQRIDAVEIEARGVQFQARLVSNDSAFKPVISELGIDAESVV